MTKRFTTSSPSVMSAAGPGLDEQSGLQRMGRCVPGQPHARRRHPRSAAPRRVSDHPRRRQLSRAEIHARIACFRHFKNGPRTSILDGVRNCVSEPLQVAPLRRSSPAPLRRSVTQCELSPLRSQTVFGTKAPLASESGARTSPTATLPARICSGGWLEEEVRDVPISTGSGANAPG